MVTKNKDKTGKGKENADGQEQKKGRIKTLNLKRETVKNLSKKEQRGVAGASGLLSPEADRLLSPEADRLLSPEA